MEIETTDVTVDPNYKLWLYNFKRYNSFVKPNLKDVPLQFRTKEMCWAAIMGNEINIIHVPDEICDIEMCWYVISRNSRFVENIPERLKTREMWWCYAIKNDINKFSSIPDKIKTFDFCIGLVLKDLCFLNVVPTQIKTAEFYNEVFKYRHEVFEHVPNKFKTYEMCLDALSRNISYVKHVPVEFFDSKICQLASKSYHFIQYIPTELLTEELCNIAFSQNTEFFVYIPTKYKTQTMCDKYVYNDYLNRFKHVPDNFKTPEMCLAAVIAYAELIKNVPDNLKTKEMCWAAVGANAELFIHVPGNLKTFEMCMYVYRFGSNKMRGLIPSEFKKIGTSIDCFVFDDSDCNNSNNTNVVYDECPICLEKFRVKMDNQDINHFEQKDFYDQIFSSAVCDNEIFLNCNEPKYIKCTSLFSCKHTFHDTCINKHFENYKHCPVCRKEITLRMC